MDGLKLKMMPPKWVEFEVKRVIKLPQNEETN